MSYSPLGIDSVLVALAFLAIAAIASQPITGQDLGSLLQRVENAALAAGRIGVTNATPIEGEPTVSSALPSRPENP